MRDPVRELGCPLLFAALLVVGCGQEDPQERPFSSGTPDSLKPFALMTALERNEFREALMREGRYDCCIKPGCMECIRNIDSCKCYFDIKNEDPICGECLDGYKEGKGKLKLVSIVELEKIRNTKERKENQ